MKKEKAKKKAVLSAAVMKQIKSLIFPVIMLLIILAGVYVVINVKPPVEEDEIVRINAYEGSTDPIVMENDDLKFTLDPTTTQFQIEVKKTGKIWYSNPQDADDDTIAKGSEKGKLKSTLLMSYSITSGLETPYNNYDYSIKNGIYDIVATKDEIKVSYSIGDVEKEYIIPPVMTEETYEKWTSKMTKEQVNMLSGYCYKKYDINKPGKKDDVEALKEKYPLYETQPIYAVRDGVKDNIKRKVEEYFEEAGYTLEDYAADKELSNATKSSDKPVFNVSMYYRLDGDDLVVEIPYNEIEYKSSSPLFTLTPLPFFGAGGTEDEGYLMVPEGGGAIINFNNGKTAQSSYEANVYSRDMAIVKDAVVHDTRAYYAAYGIAHEEDSMLCILEDGASYAAIKADISGHYNCFNFAHATYSIVQREQYKVGQIANSAIYVYLPELPDEKLVQRYHFIDSADYVDMAKEYQDYLKTAYADTMKMNDDKEAPVVIEMVAAVDKVKQVLGVPTSRPLKLTTFKEAREIMTQLQSEGLKNMSVKLTGWMNGGVNQHILKKVKLVSDCGSAKDLKNLSQAAQDLGVDLYLDGVTQYEYDSDLMDGFFSFTDAARFISKERAELYQYSMVTFAQREGADSYYLLHTDLALKMGENLINAAKKYNANVSYRDTGMDLSADYYTKKTTSREATKKLQMAQLAKASAEGTKLMINMGNDYAAVYSDMITNMDLRGSEYTIIDEYIPFYQLAIHGYKNYTGEPINLAGDPTEELLRSAEYGAGLYFNIMAESPFALQKTLYTEYFGSEYNAWHDRMVETYNKYNKELGHTYNQEMADHKVIEDGLSCTTYADGTKVYVNYNYYEKTADGVVVPARDYKVVR